MGLSKVNYKGFIWPVLVGVIIWLCTPVRPVGISVVAWHLLALFIATIVGCITQPLPIAGVALIGFTLTVLLGIAPMKEAVVAFGNIQICHLSLTALRYRECSNIFPYLTSD